MRVGERRVRLSLPDTAVLISNFFAAARLDDVGVQDIEKGYEDHLNEIDHADISLPEWLVENMLWAAHMLEEKGQFLHPQERDYKSWKAAMERRSGKKFHDDFHYVKE